MSVRDCSIYHAPEPQAGCNPPGESTHVAESNHMRLAPKRMTMKPNAKEDQSLEIDAVASFE